MDKKPKLPNIVILDFSHALLRLNGYFCAARNIPHDVKNYLKIINLFLTLIKIEDNYTLLNNRQMGIYNCLKEMNELFPIDYNNQTDYGEYRPNSFKDILEIAKEFVDKSYNLIKSNNLYINGHFPYNLIVGQNNIDTLLLGGVLYFVLDKEEELIAYV